MSLTAVRSVVTLITISSIFAWSARGALWTFRAWDSNKTGYSWKTWLSDGAFDSFFTFLTDCTDSSSNARHSNSSDVAIVAFFSIGTIISFRSRAGTLAFVSGRSCLALRAFLSDSAFVTVFAGRASQTRCTRKSGRSIWANSADGTFRSFNFDTDHAWNSSGSRRTNISISTLSARRSIFTRLTFGAIFTVGTFSTMMTCLAFFSLITFVASLTLFTTLAV